MGEGVFTDPKEAFPGKGLMKPEQLKIDRLRKEVAKLKAERDILKKAAAGAIVQRFVRTVTLRRIFPRKPMFYNVNDPTHHAKIIYAAGCRAPTENTDASA